MAGSRRAKTARTCATKATGAVCRQKRKAATSAGVAATSLSKTTKVTGCPPKAEGSGESLSPITEIAETFVATGLSGITTPKAETYEAGLGFSPDVRVEAKIAFCTVQERQN